ncbi:ras-related protein Rap-2a-like isoform X2 [Symsagittifera roscoffensis]|uniref:ras-related protein Rap-2a-like isoform X2 n=1 Tax=Symsagittifera roscoffensis TaxID=84072 RepID=UPI00307C4D01
MRKMDARRGSVHAPALEAEVFRVVFLGAPKVGKTSLVKRMLHNKYSDSYSPTVEDRYRHECITKGIKYCLEVIDTGGSCEFPAMTTLAIRAADAIVFVYAIDNRDSFERLEGLREQVFSEKEEDEVTVHVLANKSDLDSTRQVAFSEAELKVKIGWDISLSEVSARSGESLQSKLAEIIPPTFLTGIGPGEGGSGKRNSGGNDNGVHSSGGMGKRKSISEALSKPFQLMGSRASRRRDTTVADLAANQSSAAKPQASSRLSIG